MSGILACKIINGYFPESSGTELLKIKITTTHLISIPIVFINLKLKIMSVTLKVDGLTDREVLKLKYVLHQEADVEGRPSAITRGGKIEVTVKSLNDGNTDFFDWVCDPYKTKSGELSFEKRDGTNMKTLKFEEAYLVKYEELYDSIDENLQHEYFIISAKKISIGDVVHENSWADKV